MNKRIDLTQVPAYDDWLERHREALAGGWKKSFETSSGIPIKPIYTPRELEEKGWDYERDVGYPGDAPWTRMQYDINVEGMDSDVEFVCELRATSGEVWFDELTHYKIDVKKGCQSKTL